MVSTYLVHHGYCATAEAFARSTSQDLEEELTSIRNRQKIQKSVLLGRLGEAIKTVKDLYPGLLEKNSNLLFMLRVRQFIEMVNGTDSEVQSLSGSPAHSVTQEASFSAPHSCDPSYPSQRSHSPSPTPSPSSPCWTNGKLPESSKTTAQPTSVIQSTKNIMSNISHGPSSSNSLSTEELNQRNTQESNNASVIHSSSPSTANGTINLINPPLSSPLINPSTTSSSTNSTPTSSNSVSTSSSSSSSNSHINDSDIEMEYIETNSPKEARIFNVSNQSNGFTNGFVKHDEEVEDTIEEMDVEGSSSRKMCRGNPAVIERMLLLGRELQQMSQTLRRELGKNKQNKTMLQDAFSLLAYNDPWNSPVGWQLDPIQREPVCQALNSAILESHQLPRRPPLEICISHTKQLINLMSRSGLGSCAFASVEAILKKNQCPAQPPLPSSSLEQPQQQQLNNTSSDQQ